MDYTPKYTQDNIVTASEEDLRNRLAELKGLKRTKTVDLDKDEVQAQRFDAMATAYGEQDPEKMLDLQMKSQQLRNKKDLDRQKATGYLNEVAADFANIDPTDQPAWSSARARWVAIEPGLGDYIPSTASQNSWDQVQSQGGKSSNVAPKGAFAVRSKMEKDITRLSILASQAKDAGRSGDADYLTKQALELQKKLDGTGTTTVTPESVLQKYSKDISALEDRVTPDSTPSTRGLFSTIEEDIGPGAVLDKVKESIDTRLKEVQSGRVSRRNEDDDTLKTNYDTLKAKGQDLMNVKSKVAAARNLLAKNIKAGAARIAAKDLQGDVLAESEFSGYKNSDAIVQAFSHFANALAGVTFISTEDAQNLITALIRTYNEGANSITRALDGNKFAKSLLAVIKPISESFEGPTKTDGPRKGDKKIVYGIEMTFDGTVWR